MTAATSRSIVLCADDYGIAPGVGRAIRALIAAGRLSATSCMVVYPEFRAEASLLAPLAARIDVGLHLSLTHETPLRRLLRDAYLRRLDRRAIAAEVNRQVDLFVAVTGRPPDYIDGHQHVHLLPGVREPVCAAAERHGAWVRSLREPLSTTLTRPSAFAATLLAQLSRPLARRLAARGIATNRGFRGLRRFAPGTPFRELMRAMLRDARDGSVVICHPGESDATLAARDSLTTLREEELAYLAGDDFPSDLAAAGLELRRLARH